MDETQTYSSGTTVDTLRLLRTNALLEVKHFACKFRCDLSVLSPPLVPSATQANIYAVKISADSF